MYDIIMHVGTQIRFDNVDFPCCPGVTTRKKAQTFFLQFRIAKFMFLSMSLVSCHQLLMAQKYPHYRAPNFVFYYLFS